MTTLSVRIPDDLNRALEEFCVTKERSKSWVLKKILQEKLEDWADYQAGAKAFREFEIGDKKTYSIGEAMAKCGIGDDDINPKNFNFSDCD